MFSVVPSCYEVALEELAVQIDVVLARDMFWRRVLRLKPVDQNSAIGNALALAVGNAPITKDINDGPLPLSERTASECARRKIHSEKQNEFSRDRSTINFGYEDSDTIAIHLKVAGRRGPGC